MTALVDGFCGLLQEVPQTSTPEVCYTHFGDRMKSLERGNFRGGGPQNRPANLNGGRRPLARYVFAVKGRTHSQYRSPAIKTGGLSL